LPAPPLHLPNLTFRPGRSRKQPRERKGGGLPCWETGERRNRRRPSGERTLRDGDERGGTVTSDLLAADRAWRGDERRRRASEARAASGGEARAARAELGFGESKGSGKKKVGEKASWPAEPFFTLSPGYAWRIPERCATDKLCKSDHESMSTLLILYN
jgi:hypothetical protein